MKIHPTAIIDPQAQLDSTVVVGPYAVIGPQVRIAAHTHVGIGVIIEGNTTIGKGNIFHAHAVVGAVPQDKKYAGEPTSLVIGDDNTFRENVTINIGTAQDQGVTQVGSNNWIMAYVHIAHDCVIGSHTIMANATQLAGHVHVGDWAILGGMTAVHQFCRIGAHSMTGAGTVLLQDIPPYVMSQGYPATPHGINTEGLKRRGYTADDLLWIKRAYRTVYREGLSLDQAIQSLQTLENSAQSSAPAVAVFRQFLTHAGRGIIR